MGDHVSVIFYSSITFRASRFVTISPYRREPEAYSQHGPLLSSRFHYFNRRVIFGKARLYGDRIVLTGWSFRGRHRRSIPFEKITHLEYHILPKGGHLTLFLPDDRVVSFFLQQAHQWRALFENGLRYDVWTSARLFDGPEEAVAPAG